MSLPTDERRRVMLLGGPLDGDEALMATPLPLWMHFRNGWDGDADRTAHPYGLRLDGRGMPFYAWIPVVRSEGVRA